MSNITTRAQTPAARLIAAILAAILLVMACPLNARAEFDSSAANSLKIPFVQLAPNNLTRQLQFRESLSYKSPNLGNVMAHVMEVAGDDGQFGIGLCGDHNLKLGNENINSDSWLYAGLWNPNGSRPFLDYYYAVSFESDLIRNENPGQTEEWYAQALNTYEWGYAKYCTAAERYALNTLTQIVVWLDRSGKLGNMPSADTFYSGWNTVQKTSWYKVLASEMKAYYKAFGAGSSASRIDNTLHMILERYYSQDNSDPILIYGYLHESNPYTYQPMLVLWYK
ncbi:MAG: hypothetical protein K2O18_14585 [Oscillospiraceae bacterium]|nr:hypothetical protein [Oscillospiraceae bacterium]